MYHMNAKCNEKAVRHDCYHKTDSLSCLNYISCLNTYLVILEDLGDNLRFPKDFSKYI